MQHNHHLERAIRYLLPQQHNSRESVIAEVGDQSDTITAKESGAGCHVVPRRVIRNRDRLQLLSQFSTIIRRVDSQIH